MNAPLDPKLLTAAEIIARWDSGEDKPFKGELIDWREYERSPGVGCMCAQGQLLHLHAGWAPERIRDTKQVEADAEIARMLNISTAHAILLRQINDSVDGAPSIVLTDPGKVLGSEWSRLLDFWWQLDQMTEAGWRAVIVAWAAARDAAWDAAGAAARDAAWDAAWDAAGDAAWDAANAASEIQGAHLLRERGKPFFFLPLFGFAEPEAIPARPADYGVRL